MNFFTASAALCLAVSASAFTPMTTKPTTITSKTPVSSSQLSMGIKTELAKITTKSLGAPTIAAVAATAAIGTAGVKLVLDNPSRKYEEGSVAKEYDAWTQDGILEYYWGEHIHLGYYTKEEMEAGYKKKDFIEAKFDFVDEMMKLGGIDPVTDAKATVLDVGCGVGGTSRHIAKKLGLDAQVTGITLSPNQVNRATELANEQDVPNAKFTVMNALDMDFPDNSFDIVWACESGEHMPDKEAYINEMMRVLKPGGKYVMATWCQRDDREVPFTEKDEKDLRFLYEEWTHPYFISIEKYKELIDATGVMNEVTTADWNEQTIASWRHSVWVGVYDPRGFIFKPTKYLKCLRDGYCLERMHRAFDRGLMQYGMFAATKATPKEE
jgi:MPBQ/MSBQ methyltransferase